VRSDVKGLYFRWFIHSPIAHRLSARSRREKLRRLYELIGTDPSTTIIDIGAGSEWQHSENFLERDHPFPEQITAICHEENELPSLRAKYPRVNWVWGSGEALPFPDGAFDVAFSNAVLEHVTNHDHRREFIAEMLRVARICVLTTPNGMFPIELHTKLPLVHWLPNSWHNKLVNALGIGSLSKGPGNYYDPINRPQLKGYFGDHHVDIELGWLGLTLIAVGHSNPPSVLGRNPTSR
jgi:trans-aconitate methyltransferase